MNDKLEEVKEKIASVKARIDVTARSLGLDPSSATLKDDLEKKMAEVDAEIEESTKRVEELVSELEKLEEPDGTESFE